VKRLDQEPHIIGALEVRTESSRTFSARLKTNVMIQRFHVWLPSARRCRGENFGRRCAPWTLDIRL